MHDGRFIGDKVCDKTANYPDIKYCAGGFGSSCTAPSGVCEVKVGRVWGLGWLGCCADSCALGLAYRARQEQAGEACEWMDTNCP
jgi:hypothetical protein